MTYAVYLFVALVWLPGGAIQPPIARTEATLERCLADAEELVSKVDAINSENLPTMQMSYHAECRLVKNESVANPS